MIMNEYELIYVARPQLAAPELESLSEKVSGLIAKQQGEVLVTEDWGRRKMAYPINKNEHGQYNYINFVAPAEAPIGIERLLGLDDSFLRYMTVRLGENVDVEDRRVNAEAKRKERDERRAAEAEAEAIRLAERAEKEAAYAAKAASRLVEEAVSAEDIIADTGSEDSAAPAPEAAAPEAKAEAPAAEADAPEAKADAPEAKADAPEAKADAPEAEAPEAAADGEAEDA
jgi:small subunit ribosomal protein S6